MKEINYLEIFKKSVRLTWDKKILWLFGFFILLGSGGGLIFNGKESADSPVGAIWNDILINKFLLLLCIILILLLIFLLTLLRIIGQASIISFIGEMKYSEKYSFLALFRKGKKYLWRILLLDFVFGTVLIVLTATLALPVVFLLIAKSEFLAFFVGLSALAIFIPVTILLYFLRKFAFMYLVLSDLSLRDSVENAYLVFREHILSCLIFSMLLFGAAVIFGLSLFFAIVLAATPLIPFGLLAYFIFSQLGLYFSIGIGIVLLGLVFFVLRSIFETFRQIAWTFFFQELGGLKIPQAETVEKNLPSQVAEVEST